MKPEFYTDAEWAAMSPEMQQQAAAWWTGLDPATQAEYTRNKTPYTGPNPNTMPQVDPNAGPRLPSIPSVGSTTMPMSGGRPGGASSFNSMPQRGVGEASDGGVGGAIRGAGGWLKDNANWLVPVGLGVWGAIEGNRADRRASGFENRALDMAEKRYQDFEPVRTAAMERLQNAERPDLSSISFDAGNPYSAARRAPAPPRVSTGDPNAPNPSRANIPSVGSLGRERRPRRGF